jgi:hypothetical protein
LGWWLWGVREKRLNAAELARLRNSLPSCEVQFVGSSTIEFWRTLQVDISPLQVANLGVAGTNVDDVANQFARSEQVAMEEGLAPYIAQGQGAGSAGGIVTAVGDEAPQAIVFYAGDNDVAAGRSAQEVQASFERFLDAKSERFGNTPVYFISIKPTPARWKDRPVQAEVNRLIQALANKRSDLQFIDIVPTMLVNRQPGPFYVGDGIHMNADGYARWTPIVRQALGPFIKRQQAGECRTRIVEQTSAQ